MLCHLRHHILKRKRACACPLLPPGCLCLAVRKSVCTRRKNKPLVMLAYMSAVMNHVIPHVSYTTHSNIQVRCTC